MIIIKGKFVKGPNVVRDGLVMQLDAANPKSFRGEPTTNLLYDSGVINWSIGNLTINVSLQTIVMNDRYRISSTTFISPYTFGSFRFYIPLSKLTNNLPYNLSFKWRLISGGSIFSMNDWCDTSLNNVVNISYSDYNFSSASGVRATYDSTFRFMDFNISENTTVEIWDIQLEQRTYSTPFTTGTRGTTVATGGGWADRTSNANHGELVNGPTYNSANGGSIVFDGVDDIINLGNTQSLNFTTSFSISCWIRMSGWNNFSGILSKGYDTSGGYSLHIRSDYSLWFEIFSTTNVRQIYNPTNLTLLLNTWHNVVCTYNQSLMQIYIDSIPVGNGLAYSASIATTSENLIIGQLKGYGFFNGRISNVKIYNRALSTSEILQNYNATKSRFGLI